MPRAAAPSTGFTVTGRPIDSAASHAASAESTSRLAGTGTPQAVSSDRARVSSRAIPCAMALVRPVSEVQMRCARAPWPSCTRLPSVRRMWGMPRSVAAATMIAVLGSR